MFRLGLCCLFKEEKIFFKRITAKYLSKFPRKEQLEKLEQIIIYNIESLNKALLFCKNYNIGCFRVNSRIIPLITHPDLGFLIKDLPQHQKIMAGFKSCGILARNEDIRLTFHPDQFILLSSPDQGIVDNSVRELEYQTMVSEWINADVINIHAGGKYDDKKNTLKRLVKKIKQLDTTLLQRLTLENDDRCYTPEDLFPVCAETGIPLVYDIHHHRCLPDNLNESEVTTMALRTWNRQPLFHISSPKYGWKAKNPKPHSDFIDINDFPSIWQDLNITIEVEAKFKELAVIKLHNYLLKKFD